MMFYDPSPADHRYARKDVYFNDLELRKVLSYLIDNGTFKSIEISFQGKLQLASGYATADKLVGKPTLHGHGRQADFFRHLQRLKTERLILADWRHELRHISPKLQAACRQKMEVRYPVETEKDDV